MNVILEIADNLCQEARHRAVDAHLSLSDWVAGLIRKEIDRSSAKRPRSLLGELGNGELAEFELEFPRDQSPARDLEFS
jgi:hypothetical protein